MDLEEGTDSMFIFIPAAASKCKSFIFASVASFYKAPVLVLWLNNLYYIIRLLYGGCSWIPFISWQIIVFFKCSQVFPSEGVLSTDREHELWPNGPQSLLACVNTILGRGSLSLGRITTLCSCFSSYQSFQSISTMLLSTIIQTFVTAWQVQVQYLFVHS